jgi:hypothetical protein
MKKTNLLSHAAAALLVTMLSGLIYVAVQQSHRSGANDPQLQIARDIRERLKNNQSIDRLMSGDTVEISKSLAVFTVLYDMNGKPVQSNGLLDGKLPEIPKGVFDFTRKKRENVLTWQPRKGVRMAMVVESVQSPGIAFVAAGRSLNEVEKRISNLTTMLFIGWLACLGVILVHWVIVTFRNKNQ